ncbi:MAG: hypothetical protein GX136_03800, partial [Clostridiales bacterium]|nr:hypothetical protein [Clostridiales bacterium]
MFSIGLIICLLIQLCIKHCNFLLDFRLLGLVSVCESNIVLIGYQSGSAIFTGRHTCVRYRGYYYDTESGLYYLQSRYYDPEIGRFISKDDPIF